MCLKEHDDRQHETTLYASLEDFCRVFGANLDGLHQLSFLLTGDPKKAEQCFVAGLEDCVTSNNVFREWAHSWAKRAIVQNAIRILQPSPGSAASSLPPAVGGRRVTAERGPLEIDRVLALADFERFVFVMSVLERYSEHDCTLLLNCTVWEVREARIRVLERMAPAPPSSSGREFTHILQETK